MAVLSEADRAKCARVANRVAAIVSGATYNKVALRAAVDAADDWIDTNAASFVAALPVAFRTATNATQKTVLFLVVACVRAGLPLSWLARED